MDRVRILSLLLLNISFNATARKSCLRFRELITLYDTVIYVWIKTRLFKTKITRPG